MAASTVLEDSVEAPPIAPWWHTLLVMVPLAAGSILGWRKHTMTYAHVPGLGPRLSSYLLILAEEWFVVLLIWLWARTRGLRLRDLIGGRWRGPAAFFKDLGIAVGFLVITVPAIGILMHLAFPHTNDNLAQMTPKTLLELCVWFVLSASGGFGEELTFRGYFNRQFSAWTNSAAIGLIAQAILFGLVHGYYHGALIVIMLDGLFYGLLAKWRKSLRPGMLAHGLQDAVGGLLAYLS
jgi:uncharacterized protein